MKRIILTAAILLSICLHASAQEGLFVEGLFEGEIVPRTEMKQTFIRGESLKPYKLDTFKSISFTADVQTYHKVETLVLHDAEASMDKSTDFVGGHLTYAVLSLPRSNSGRNRYLCFRAREDQGKWLITVIYLRGQAAIDDLNRMFNKREK